MIGRRTLFSWITSIALLEPGYRSITGRTRATQSTRLHNHDSTGGDRDDRVQLVRANPDFGFNFPFWLATPESFRSEPVPLLFEMNNADETDSYDKVKFGRAKSQITDLAFQGAWLSEELGVPHIKPIVPRPNGDPIDSSHWTIMLDRETMLLDRSVYERLDRQLIRMADYAREEVLTDISTHEKLLFYGNSSEGQVAARMAAMHPDEITAAAAGGINGFVLLPLEELGGRPLIYSVGVADFEPLLGRAYDRDAHDEVDLFFFQGGDDPKNRLKMAGSFPNDLYNSRQLYDTARAVYGARMVEDRLPRCHIAYEKAGVDAQFRVYPEMTHNPRPASHDLLDFFETSLAGEDVSGFGQSFELPLDREPVVVSREDTADGIDVEFAVSGRWPPPGGLVNYSWAFGDGGTATGQLATHTYDGPGSYEVTLSMRTAHGQQADNVSRLTFFDVSQVEWSSSELFPGEEVSASATVRNPAPNPQTVQIAIQRMVDGSREAVHTTDVSFDAEESKTVTIEGVVRHPGDHVLTVAGQPVSEPVTVLGDPDKPISFVVGLEEPPAIAGAPVAIEVHVVFNDVDTSGTLRFPVLLNGRVLERASVEYRRTGVESITVEHTFNDPGTYEIGVEVGREQLEIGTVEVEAESTPTATPTPTPTPSPTETHSPSETTSAQSPGFGVIAALAGLLGAVGYRLSRTNDREP